MVIGPQEVNLNLPTTLLRRSMRRSGYFVFFFVFLLASSCGLEKIASPFACLRFLVPQAHGRDEEYVGKWLSLLS